MEIEKNYISSLLAKPFVILTGSSGTGKTRLAMQIAEAIDKNKYSESLIDLQVDNRGKILNKSEDEIKNLCKKSNLFQAVINGNEVGSIKITMCNYIESEDTIFMSQISDRDQTIIQLFNILSEKSDDKNYELVPVGADWTDVRYLLGYTNPFGEEGKKTYEITSALKIILRALHPDNKYKPYFLILDEMNLSHVERYFSTFLSVMEANRSTCNSIAIIGNKELRLISDILKENTELKIEFESAKALIKEKMDVYLPQNLYIVGTINVDETTYMFSPKVLDRAHVIELSTQSPKKYFEELKTNELKKTICFDSNEVNKILKLFRESIENRISDNQNPVALLKESIANSIKQNEILDGIEKVMEGIYTLLEPCGFGYGYRIVNEVLEFVKYSIDFVGSDSWIEILDKAVLQKIFPKIHGNRRQLGDCLMALIKFLDGQACEYMYGNKTIKVEATNIKLHNSKNKIQRMVENLNYTGYTSFIS